MTVKVYMNEGNVYLYDRNVSPPRVQSCLIGCHLRLKHVLDDPDIEVGHEQERQQEHHRKQPDDERQLAFLLPFQTEKAIRGLFK